MGVFSSVRSSSHTWPVVFSGWPCSSRRTLWRDCDHSKIAQPAMPSIVIRTMYQFQKPLVKSDIVVHLVIGKGQRGRRGEVPLLAQYESPGHDAQETNETHDRHHAAR